MISQMTIVYIVVGFFFYFIYKFYIFLVSLYYITMAMCQVLFRQSLQ